MQPRTVRLLADMRSAAAFILRHAEGISLDEYVGNEFLRLSVERQFEIIGEAGRRIALTDPSVAVQIADLPSIIAFRNLIAHGYDEIDHVRLLTIVKSELPSLLVNLEQIIDQSV